MNTETMTLTHQAASLLFSAATKVVWPASLGTGKYGLVFDDQERASIMESAVALGGILERKAKLEGKEWLVGERACWSEKPNELGRYTLTDPYVPLEIETTGMARVGMYWLLLWMAHPASTGYQPAGIHREVIFPLVRMLGKEEALRYDLGLLEEEPAKK